MLQRRDNFIKMKGNETFKLAVKTLSNDVKEILEKNSIPPSKVDYFIPHQANYRIIKAVGALLDFDEKQIVLTVQKYGNTSSASIPMAIEDTYNQGKLKGGELLLLDAFGGGLTWGSSLLYFNPQRLNSTPTPILSTGLLQSAKLSPQPLKYLKYRQKVLRGYEQSSVKLPLLSLKSRLF
eukprot:TRINITY_DN70988_c0_g1_i1.p2 TRINITY_DN70988_c0_g1~~TRINITY_DN70988_c0_g1_i1.p2  ORF type:complete len:211 (+),score=10.73 TRINITY_DN70988_c0_g1_i1:96-635(+)